MKSYSKFVIFVSHYNPTLKVLQKGNYSTTYLVHPSHTKCILKTTKYIRYNKVSFLYIKYFIKLL